mgnify:CR=1 FL=1
MKIRERFLVHYVIPYSETEYLAACKTLECVTCDGTVYSDLGVKEKWNEFLTLYDRLAG